ncbi:hypothetical protein CAL7716_100290 (plasmid) [Calothrix sp. PCC 7716]|nr:hypothetical protein CAL7716_100290 [Calothrix sp. PCC 7716]
MGYAAYNRGSLNIRRQIEREVKESLQNRDTSEIISWQRAKIKELLTAYEEIEAKLADSTTSYNELVAENNKLKSQLKEVEAENIKLNAKVDRLRHGFKSANLSLIEFTRRWKLVSQILRDNYTEKQIAQLKESVYQRFPQLRRHIPK